MFDAIVDMSSKHHDDTGERESNLHQSTTKFANDYHLANTGLQLILDFNKNQINEINSNNSFYQVVQFMK